MNPPIISSIYYEEIRAMCLSITTLEEYNNMNLKEEAHCI
ncbi:hypothetical protein BTJ45_02854 [Bacillus mycoides]|nr:hypothetical protein BTJ45_02854 [Bacillus mycoides]